MNTHNQVYLIQRGEFGINSSSPGKTTRSHTTKSWDHVKPALFSSVMQQITTIQSTIPFNKFIKKKKNHIEFNDRVNISTRINNYPRPRTTLISQKTPTPHKYERINRQNVPGRKD